MEKRILTSRRRFLFLSGGLAAGLALPANSRTAFTAEKKEAQGKAAEVNPVEDLMREHGILRRVLLIYEEAFVRLDGGKDLPPGVMIDAAGIIRRFVEDYHERLEEEELFPRFQKAGKLVDLVKVLYDQHKAGRRLTDLVLQSSTIDALKTPKARQELHTAIHQFIRMYRPHAAREDTVLFPALRSIVSPGEFDALGEKFEDKEEDLFGKEGFEKVVETVGEIEKKLGIFDLPQFTPGV